MHQLVLYQNIGNQKGANRYERKHEPQSFKIDDFDLHIFTLEIHVRGLIIIYSMSMAY